MKTLPRLYQSIIADHLAKYRQMALLTGPRQVGKTTLAKALGDVYLNYDDPQDRAAILAGPSAVDARVGLDSLSPKIPVIVFDELQKHRKWKDFLKGYFDGRDGKVKCVVTGSARLDIWRKAGDSLMGRYFPYRIHPLSVAELLRTDKPKTPIHPPRHLDEPSFKTLVQHGGFPEPFLRKEPAFTRRWQDLRLQQLFRDDLRDLTRVQEITQVEALAGLLKTRSGEQIVAANLARDLGANMPSIQRWISLLASLHHGFLLRPYTKSVTGSLRKTPKWYLRDWAMVDDPGKRAETLTACHLLKAVEGWTDLGLGRFDVAYLRDKQQREVDFVVLREGKPWFLVEVKLTPGAISPALKHFQTQTGAEHAFQAVFDMPFVDADCFTRHTPTQVPLRTLLSQLL